MRSAFHLNGKSVFPGETKWNRPFQWEFFEKKGNTFRGIPFFTILQ